MQLGNSWRLRRHISLLFWAEIAAQLWSLQNVYPPEALAISDAKNTLHNSSNLALIQLQLLLLAVW